MRDAGPPDLDIAPLKFKFNMQLYAEVICGRHKPPQGSVWAAGLHEESEERMGLLLRRYWSPQRPGKVVSC